MTDMKDKQILAWNAALHVMAVLLGVGMFWLAQYLGG